MCRNLQMQFLSWGEAGMPSMGFSQRYVLWRLSWSAGLSVPTSSLHGFSSNGRKEFWKWAILGDRSFNTICSLHSFHSQVAETWGFPKFIHSLKDGTGISIHVPGRLVQIPSVPYVQRLPHALSPRDPHPAWGHLSKPLFMIPLLGRESDV